MFFTEHLWISAFILQQLLALNFAIIYSWQLSSSGKSLVREKNSPIYLKDFSDLEFFYTAISFFFSFSLKNAYLPCRLRKTYAKLWVGNRFVVSETPKQKAFDQYWKLKFHFEHVPINTRFLSFDGPRNYSYLFKNHRQMFSWPGECPSSHVKVAKISFCPNIRYLSESFFADFHCREDISYIFLWESWQYF